jgi:hypothetical protein
MALGIEKRLYPRIPVNWSVVILTPKGAISGETRNISVGGACIQYSEEADLNCELHIVFEDSEQRPISVTGIRAWSGNFNIDGKSVFSAVGVRFTEISFEDREFISSLARIFHESMSRDRETGNPLAGLSGAQQANRKISGLDQDV